MFYHRDRGEPAPELLKGDSAIFVLIQVNHRPIDRVCPHVQPKSLDQDA